MIKLVSLLKSAKSSASRRNRLVTKAKRPSVLAFSDFYLGLEERQLLSSFSHNLNTVMIDLDNPDQILTITATANSYKFVLSGAGIGKNGWTGTNGSGLSSFLSTLTASATAQGNFNTFLITDSAANTTVIFDDSGVNTYVNNFNITLNNFSNSVQFNGNSTFAGNNNLAILTDSRAELTSGACLTMANGDLSMDINTQASPQVLPYPGLMVNNATIQTLGSGSTTIAARGGYYAPQSPGVYLLNFGRILGGTSGNLSVTGYGLTNNSFPVDNGIGVFVQTSSLISSIGSGPVNVVGYGSGSPNSRYSDGVFVSGTISSGGSGPVNVVGYGGGNGGKGVGVAGTITSGGSGLVSVTGYGSDSDSSTINTVGVSVAGMITSGTNGSVTVNGTASDSATGPTNEGVAVGGTIAAGPGTGSTSVTGTGGGCGTSMQNVGVLVNDGLITALGSGNVTVMGYGGNNSTGNHSYGVLLEGYYRSDGILITSNGGDVVVTGVGGGGLANAASPSNASDCAGVLLTQGGVITAGGNGSVTVSGQGGNRSPGATGSSNDGVDVASFSDNHTPWRFSKITSSGGPVHVSGTGGGGSGTTVSSNLSSNNTGVHIFYGGQITSGGNGDLTIDGTGGGYGKDAGDYNIGVWLDSGLSYTLAFYPSCITTGGNGNLTINGTGGGVGNSSYNMGVDVQNGAVLTSGGTGLVTITGNGGNTNATASVSDYGLYVQKTTITSGGGNIVVNGRGGGKNGNMNIGVYLIQAGRITAPGTASVTVNGWGGNANGTSGGYSSGVVVSSSVNGVHSAITSNNGTVIVKGYGGNTNATITNSVGQSYGVSVNTEAEISAGGTGSVSVTGTGGGMSIGATSNNEGVYVARISGTVLPRISSAGGSVNVTGYGGGTNGSGTNNHGVDIQDGAIVTSTGYGAPVNVSGYGGGGNATTGVSDGIYMLGSDTYNTHTITANGGLITLHGKAGNGSASLGLGQWNYRTSVIGNATTPGNITILADSIGLSTWGSAINASNWLVIAPITSGVGVNLGCETDNSTGPLALSNTEIADLNAATIQIGNTNTGNLTISSAVSVPSASNLSLVTKYTATTGIIGTNTLTMAPGKTLDISAVPSLQTLVNGNVPQTGYSQLSVVGNLSIAGRSLSLSGSYVPLPGDRFIVANATNLTGTFSGQADGSTTKLNGSTLVVNYNATSVTLTEPTPVVTTQPADTAVAVGTQVSFTATASVAGNIATTVQWQKKNSGGLLWNDISGATATTYSFTTTAADNGDQYRAVFTNAYAQTNSSAATLTLDSSTSAPSITGQPADVGVEIGQSATFTATATGSPAPTVQWQKKNSGGLFWNDISGATSTTYSFTTVAGDNGDKYRAVFTNASGTATTNAATLTIGVAPQFTSESEMSIPLGLNSGLSVIATGSPKPTYSITAGTLPTGVTLNSTTGLLSGTPAAGTAGNWPITIQASNGIGTAATQAFSLKVVSSVTSFVISKGQAQRSYIRYIDIGLDSNASALALLNNPGRVHLTRADLDGNGATSVPITSFMSVPTGQSKLAFDFGAVGLGNSRNTSTADGYYTLCLDLDDNGTFETNLFFFRLYGDINGDAEVNAADQATVLAGCTQAYAANLDLNGDGKVNTSDLIYVKKAVGRRLRVGLIVTS